MKKSGADYFREVIRAIKSHETWRVKSCLNLAAAENCASMAVRSVLSSDLGNRYSDRNDFHKGTKYLNQVEETTRELACKVFNTSFADVRPISGHTGVIAVLLALTKRGEKIFSVSPSDGGYPGLTQRGLGSFLGIQNLFFPYDPVAVNINAMQSKKLISKEKPKLLVFGASHLLFPQPVREILESTHEDAFGVYDGSHVLGLMAGGEFQNPLEEGCSILLGSTHKSLPGPQGGIILSNDEQIFNRVVERLQPAIVDNIHWNRVAALGIALAEMLEFGKDYARAIIKNSKALGKFLHEEGLRLKGSSGGFSCSHQLIMDYSPRLLKTFANKLERANIIIDAGGRIGTAEVTRLGMGIGEMEEISELILSSLKSSKSREYVGKQVQHLVRNFQEPIYYLKN